MITPRFFGTSAALQDFILQEAGPGTLVIVPHRRLAQQLWQRQRQAQLRAGRTAWEPLAVKTFQGWLQDLFTSLWPEVALAPDLLRWSLTLRAIQATPELPGVAADLTWAQALDEAYGILCRHSLLQAGRASKWSGPPWWGRRPRLPFPAAITPDHLAKSGDRDFQAAPGGGRLAGAGGTGRLPFGAFKGRQA